jgi:hypothetical protein
MPKKGVYTIKIPMTNCPPLSMHRSLDPLCIPLSLPQPNIGDINQNTSYEETPTNATPSMSPHVPTIPLGMVTQFGVPMVESYVPPNHWHLRRTTNITRITCCVSCCLCKQCCSMFNIHKTKGTNCSPLFPWTTLQLTPSLRPLKVFSGFSLVIWPIMLVELYQTLSTKKPPLPNVWLVNPSTNIIQCWADALGRVGFVFLHGTPHVTPIIELNELYILPGVARSVKNGCKICVRYDDYQQTCLG